MKQKVVIFLTIMSFLLLLLFPKQVFQGASSGLLLWFHTMLPTLLPFLIVTNFFMETSTLEWLCQLIPSSFTQFFHTSKAGAFAIFTGFLCGYPMGSKIIATLVKQQKLSLAEGNYLLSFCNNTSPVFLISFVLFQCLDAHYAPYPYFFLCILVPIVCSQIFYYCFYKRQILTVHSACLLPNSRQTLASSSLSGKLFDSCIMNSFETITKIGGYMMIFSIVRELCSVVFSPFSWINYLLIASLELTNGISSIAQSPLSPDACLILCLSHTAFGGWCSIAQTASMIQDSGLKLFPYILEKLITALVTSLFLGVIVWGF